MKKLYNRWFSFIVVLLVSTGITQSIAQTTSITGTIKDQADGSALPGANILIKGTSNGTITDADGAFTVNANVSDILIISSIGYVSQEVSVNNRTNIDIQLAVDATQLEEIVVVGYGTQNKEEVTGAVATVNVDNLQKLPGANVASLLQGQVAGVSATSGSGSPGGDPVVRIRGLGTIGNNNPLYVIDGIPSDISTINPSDIESVTVLKDAAAATIYGSRAASGVIIVTTKSGVVGAPVVTFNSYMASKKITKKLDLLDRAGNNSVSTAAYAAEGLAPLAYTSLTGSTNTDWQDEMFRPGVEQKYDLAVSGGSETAKYNFSLGYFDNKGTILGSDFSRYNFRVNTEFKVSDRITVGQAITYSRSDRNRLGEDESSNNGGNSGFSPLFQILSSMPHNAAYDASTADGFGNPVAGSGNIVGSTKLITDLSQNDRLQGNFFIEAKIIDGLKFRTRVGANVYNNASIFRAQTYAFGPQDINDQGDLSEFRGRTTNLIWNNVLDYDKTFGDHHISALAGISVEENVYRSTGGSNNDIPSNKLSALGSGIGDANSFGSNITSSLRSFFTRVNYDYDNKYLIQLTARSDGSSKFGPNNQTATFPSASVGWRMSSEDFFNVEIINDLKVRYSYGVLGNQEIGNYLFLPLISTNNGALNYPFGGGESQNVSVGSISTSLADQNIKWEESTTSNFGLDLGLMENRIGVTFDYFNTTTKDMLVQVPIPPTTGIVTFPFTNAGEMENKGWEMSLSYRKAEGDFKYNVRGNISHSKNKVTKLGFEDEAFVFGHVIFDTHPTTKTEVGRSIGDFYFFKSDGLFQTQAEIDAHGTQPNAAPGDIRFVDTNNDGVLDDDDRTYLGSGLPDFEYGITFNASYKKFDFSLFIEGSAGNEIYNGTKVLLYRRQNDIKNFSADLLNAWTPSNTNTDIPRVTQGDPNQNIRPSDYFMENGSYLRLKNLQVGYNIGAINKIFSNARVYFSAENLMTISGYSGYDPAAVGYQQFSRGVDTGLYPASRSLIIGAQLRF